MIRVIYLFLFIIAIAAAGFSVYAYKKEEKRSKAEEQKLWTEIAYNKANPRQWFTCDFINEKDQRVRMMYFGRTKTDVIEGVRNILKQENRPAIKGNVVITLSSEEDFQTCAGRDGELYKVMED